MEWLARSLVCDGDVEVKGRVDGSVVIARGDIQVTHIVLNSTVIAGGKCAFTSPQASDPRFNNILKSNDPNPLGFVTFFELSRIGVEVATTDKVVRITDVADAKAFVLAGAKVGDVVEGVNGTKPDSAESLRKLLRDALAVGDAAVKVTRGDAAHTLRVVLPE